jgi:predicted DCC family thiol-disulfide oxidoreductase YuxK
MIKQIKNYPPLQFALFRIIFGVYLTVHFGQLLSVGPAIWSNEGMMAENSLNFTYGKFPNILNTFDSPLEITLFLVLLTILSICITLGRFRRVAALLLWYGWACLYHRNNLIGNPGIPMMGWLLLAMTLIPKGDPLCFRAVASPKNWYMPSILFWGAWIIVGSAYTISGFDKLMAPSWQNGTAIGHLLENPLARDWFLRELLLKLPEFCIHLFTWAALILEITFGLLCLSKRTRPIAWLSIMCMHLGILLVVDFADLTLGVIMIHLFTFDPSWFKSHQNKETQNVVLFDGICGLCNSWVNILLSIDLDGRFKYSTLQGSFAQSILSDSEIKNLKTIVYARGNEILTKSTAILAILRDLGGVWAIFSLFRVIPAFLRDIVYALVSENRYRIFGKHDTCRIPTPEERAKFID